jgi:hypothetical protein
VAAHHVAHDAAAPTAAAVAVAALNGSVGDQPCNTPAALAPAAEAAAALFVVLVVKVRLPGVHRVQDADEHCSNCERYQQHTCTTETHAQVIASGGVSDKKTVAVYSQVI